MYAPISNFTIAMHDNEKLTRNVGEAKQIDDKQQRFELHFKYRNMCKTMV